MTSGHHDNTGYHQNLWRFESFNYYVTLETAKKNLAIHCINFLKGEMMDLKIEMLNIRKNHEDIPGAEGGDEHKLILLGLP